MTLTCILNHFTINVRKKT